MNFQTLYENNKNLVFNLALQYVQNTEDAEEVTQDVFMKVYKKKDTFQKRSTATTWIYRITINTALDYVKARNRKKRKAFLYAVRMDDESKGFDMGHFDHPGVALEQKESIAEIFKGINELSENQKTAVILLKIEQLPISEVAEILNISEKATESLFQRAKTNLKKILQQNEEAV